MKHSKAEPRLEELSEPECLELLAQQTLGRVAIVVDGRPQIFPVNYAMYGDVIVLRTAPGTKLLQDCLRAVEHLFRATQRITLDEPGLPSSAGHIGPRFATPAAATDSMWRLPG